MTMSTAARYITAYAFIIFICALATSCAARPSRQSAIESFRAGQTALKAGDLLEARDLFNRALERARAAQMGQAAEGDILALLGQVYGNLCQYDSAEKALLQTVDAYAAAFGSTSRPAFTARMDMAQFSYDIGRYDQAVRYFDHALSVGGEDMHNRSPAAFAATLRDYADALTKVGDHDKAREVAARTVAVERVIGKAQVDRAAAEYQRYPAGCRS